MVQYGRRQRAPTAQAHGQGDTIIVSAEPRTRRRIGRIALFAVGVASLVALYGPSLRAHVERSSHPLVYHDDARQQIAPFHRYAAPDLLRDDLHTDYYLGLFPVGYHVLYAAAAMGWSPIGMSWLLQYVLLGLTLAGLSAAAWRLGGGAAAWGTAALALSSTALLRGLGGGLPHSFAFPLLSLGLALLVHGRLRALAALAALAAGFYPIAGVLLGLTLAIVLLLTPPPDRGSARGWSLRRRLVVLAATATIMASLQLAPALKSRSWGELIGPADFEAYPEAGIGGRYGWALARPWPRLVASIPGTVEAILEARGAPFSPSARDWLGKRSTPSAPNKRRRALAHAVLALGCLGWLGLARTDPAARRLLAFPLALAVAHTAARMLDPAFYLPIRYVGYAIPTLALVLVPASVGGLLGWVPALGRRPWAVGGGVLLASATLLVFVGGQVDLRAGAGQDARRFAPLFDMAARTPRHAVIAGWPSGPVQDLPLVARRAAFLSWESHQAFHAGYLDTLRGRMRALVDAYYATSAEPLVRLRDEHGVTHLLVDPAHYGERPPGYFAPFNTWIRPAWSRARRHSEVLRQIRSGGAERVRIRSTELVLLPLDGIGKSEQAEP